MLSKKITQKQVEEFLKDNSDFFLRNPSLLKSIKFPSSTNTNLQQKNPKVIGFKDWLINNLKQQQKNIIENAKHNYFTQKKVHSAVIEINKVQEKDFFLFIRKNLSKFFELAIINFVTSNKELSSKFDFIYITEEKMNEAYNTSNHLILDAADKELGIFESNEKIYSNAIFSIDKRILNSKALLVFGSQDRQFLDNRAFDLILFLSRIIEFKLMVTMNE